jgi:hypothetical protein
MVLFLLGHLIGCIKPEIAGPESSRLINVKEAFVFEQTPPPKKRLHAMVEVLNWARTPQFCNRGQRVNALSSVLFFSKFESQHASRVKWDISLQLPLFSRGTLFLAICRGVKQCER